MLSGYCTGCRRIRSVRVAGIPITGTPVGLCTACSRAEQAAKPSVPQRSFSGPPPVAEGTRIRLIAMGDDPCPLPAGSTGTVVGGNSGQLWVTWDDRGRSLNLSLPEDTYEVIA